MVKSNIANGWTKKEVERLRYRVDTIYDKIHEIDKVVFSLDNELKGFRKDFNSYENSTNKKIDSMYSKVINNRIIIAQYFGMGGLGGVAMWGIFKLIGI